MIAYGGRYDICENESSETKGGLSLPRGIAACARPEGTVMCSSTRVAPEWET